MTGTGMLGGATLTVLPPAGRRYTAGEVVVERRADGQPLRAERQDDGRVHVTHGFDSGRLDDDLAEALADALTGVTTDHGIFARAFAGVVGTSDPDPDLAWSRFYRNTLARADDASRAGYGQVHRRAVALLKGHGSVLDLGCSFGFLALLLAQGGTCCVAADVDRGVLRMVATISGRMRVPVSPVLIEPGDLPLAARSVDAVAMLHVLEHGDAEASVTLLDQALRVARRRVVVAVPYETGPTALFGHRRTLDRADLLALGAGTDWCYRVEDWYGGWLILDRPAGDGAAACG
jgi:SAM-dependent methyltransferase